MMGTDQHEVGVLDDEMSIGGIDLDALENLASMDSVEDSLEETSVFQHDEGQFEGNEGWEPIMGLSLKVSIRRARPLILTTLILTHSAISC